MRLDAIDDGEVHLESPVGHLPAAKTPAIGWPVICGDSGLDPPKSLDLGSIDGQPGAELGAAEQELTAEGAG